MTERLGFNDTLLFLAVAGIAAFALGTLITTSSGYMDASDADGREAREKVRVTGALFKDLGMIGAGAAIVLAAIRAEGHSTVIRAVMLVLGLAVLFKMFTIGFSGGIST